MFSRILRVVAPGITRFRAGLDCFPGDFVFGFCGRHHGKSGGVKSEAWSAVFMPETPLLLLFFYLL